MISNYPLLRMESGLPASRQGCVIKKSNHFIVFYETKSTLTTLVFKHC